MDVVNQDLKALCLEILRDNIGSHRFNMLLVQTGIRLDTIEWDIANKILGKGDELNHSIKCVSTTVQ